MNSGVGRLGLSRLLARWLPRGLGALVVAVIDSIAEAVDSVLARVPNPVPTAGQLRHTRTRGGEQLRGLGRVACPARRPVLAGVGEILVHRVWSPCAVTA
jgi:hypothetical protein